MHINFYNISINFTSKLLLKENLTTWDQPKYRKVASSNTSRLEAHAGFFRLLMKGIFDAYVLWPFGKKLIFELVMCVSTRDSTVVVLGSNGAVWAVENPALPIYCVQIKKDNGGRNILLLELILF